MLYQRRMEHVGGQELVQLGQLLLGLGLIGILLLLYIIIYE